MSQRDTTESIELAVDKPAKKAKSKPKKKPKIKAKVPRQKTEKSPKTDHGFDFIGKVDSLRVKSGVGAEGLEFQLRGRHGKRKSFRFDTNDGFAVNVMVHLVLAAHAGDTKIGVRTAAEVEGALIVRDLEIRHKFGKD